MRQKGQLKNWVDHRGFGFITPKDGGEDVFVHISSFPDRHQRPTGNELLSYKLETDKRGRLQAKDVAFISNKKGIRGFSIGGGISKYFPASFLAAIGAAAFAGKLPFVVLGLYAAASAIAFIVYAIDKSAAQNNRWRTPESTLHLIALVGGWPGALAAQKLLRHKSSKKSFQLLFWATVILNCCGLVWVMTDSGWEFLQAAIANM